MKKLLVMLMLSITVIGCAKVSDAPETNESIEVTEDEVYGIVTSEGTCILVNGRLEDNKCQNVKESQ